MPTSSSSPSSSAFISNLLCEQLRDSGSTPEFLGRQVSGTVMFIDIVDSTMMTDRIAASGPEGAEQLGKAFNRYFGCIFDIILGHGGDVIRVVGDAVMALWRDKNCSTAPHLRAAYAAIALRGLHYAWPVEGDEPLRHRLTLASGTFSTTMLSGNNERRFFVFTGKPLRTIQAISHAGEPGEIILDAEMARLLAPFGLVRVVVDQDGARHGAVRLEHLGYEAALHTGTATVASSVPPPAATEAFVPRGVERHVAPGMSAWLPEFRMLTMVYIRLEESPVLDVAAAEQMHAVFKVVAGTADALGVEIYDVVADDKGVIALIACGLPQLGSESNASRAVELARRVRDDLAAFPARYPIGVATGRVFCGEVGNTSRREYVLIGPVTNYGARLMQAAGNGVLCDVATARTTDGRFVFTAPDVVAVKGRSRSLTVYRLRGTRTMPGRAAASRSGLFGRDGELAQLTTRLDRLRDGQGGIIVLEGEPGAGKSRLLAEIGHIARQRGCAVMDASADVIEQATAYFTFRSIMKQLLQRSGDLGEDSAQSLRDRLTELLAKTRLASLAALVEDIMPLGMEDARLASQIKGEARRAGVEDIVVALLSRRASQSSLILLLDDLHWIDVLSAALLLALARRVPNVLLFVASRPPNAGENLHGTRVLRSASLRIAVGRLGPTSTAKMVRELLAVRALPRQIVEFVHARSEGLPVHVEQLVLSLLEEGLVEVANGKCRVTAADLAITAVPHKLRDVVVSRLDRLGQADRLTAKVASSIGRNFEIEALQEIHPEAIDGERLKESVDRLVLAGFLMPVLGRNLGSYSFHHVTVQEATYELLSYAQRRLVHRRLVERIERRHATDLETRSAELAHHCEHAADFERSIKYHLVSATAAVRRYANEDALMHVDRAQRLAERARLPVSVSDRAQMALNRGEALHNLSRFLEAQQQFQKCLTLKGLGCPISPSRVALAIAGQVVLQGLRRLGVRRRIVELAGERRARLSARVHTRLAEQAYFTRNALAVVHGTLTALNQAESVGSILETVEGYGALAVGLGTVGLHSTARFYLRRSMSLAEGSGGFIEQGYAHFYAATYACQAGDWDATRDYSSKGGEICARLGDRFRSQACRVVETYAAIETGDYASAAALLEVFGPGAEKADNASVRAWVLSEASILDMLKGQSPALTLDRMEAIRGETPHLAERLMCDGLEAAACMQSGDAVGALHAARRALESTVDGVCTMGFLGISLFAMAEVLLTLAARSHVRGRCQNSPLVRARVACRAVERYASGTRICRPRATLLTGKLALLEGREQQSERHFKRALFQAKRLRMPFDQAMCHLALARVTADVSIQTAHATRAAALLHNLGAHPWAFDIASD